MPPSYPLGTQVGNLDAPCGMVSISFMYVLGASALVAELGSHGADALSSFKVSSALFLVPQHILHPSTS